MIALALRSAIFYVLFIGQTVILAIVIALIGMIAKRRTRLAWALARYWGWSNIWLLRIFASIKTEVSGAENIPPGGCIIASKHQSDWDVFAILPYTGRPAYIVKKELMRIPFFGWAARSLDCIEVDRSKGAEALADMTAQARAAIGRGCRIVIFPEGTRKAPLAQPSYKYGLARLYTELNVPVVPVALNSGLFWGRNSPLLWRGTAKARFLPAIPPGLSTEEFQQRLIGSIEAASNELILDAYHQGLSRPISPELREKLQALEAQNS